MENDRKSGTRRTYVRPETDVGAPPAADAHKRRSGIAAPRKKKKSAGFGRYLKNKRVHTVLISIAAGLLALILLLMTPVFDIREIRVEGNKVVDVNAISNKIGDYVGTNMFRLNTGEMESRLREISQVSDVRIKKHIFPPYVTVEIEEAVPVAYLMSTQRVIVINSDLKVIDDSGLYDTEGLPSISGVSVPGYALNQPLVTDSGEKEDLLRELLSALEKTGVLYKTTYISIDDITDIRFNYDNRLEVLCGSQLELERKIRMFAEALNSSALSDNSIGRMDLSVPGQAVYTP